MATVNKNTIKIYVDSGITRDKNREIDDIETFLTTHRERCYTYENIQFFKHGLHRTIKLDLQIEGHPSQEYLGNNGITNIDYVSIQNKDIDSNPIYYFVEEKRWIAEKTIELVLLQDTINSHKTEYTLSKKSMIDRQHANRFKRINDGYANFWREIDITPEGLNVTLFNTSDPKNPNYVLPEGQYADTHYYMLFKANEDITELSDNPVDLYITDNKGLSYAPGTAGESATLSGSDMPSIWHVPTTNLAIIIDQHAEEVYNVSIETAGGAIVNTQIKYPDWSSGNGPRILEIKPASSGNPAQFNVFGVQYRGGEDFGNYGERIIVAVDAVRLTITAANSFTALLRQYDSTYPSGANTPDLYDWESNTHASTVKTMNSGAADNSQRVLPINEVNRTDSKMLRIIELPYCPFQTQKAEGSSIYYYDPNYFEMEEQGSGTGKYLIKAKTLWAKAILRNTIKSDYDPLSQLDYRPSTRPFIATRNDDNESKLFHSDFYLPKFIYDSFAFPIMLERVDKLRYVWDSHKEFNVKFIPTTTMNSRFLFYFQDYNTKGLGYEDYPAYLNVARNNEVCLYTNAYLDYLRTGYNYDVKAKERQQTSNWVNFGGSVLGTAAAGVATYMSGGAAAPFLISGVGSMMTSGYNALSQGGTPDFLKGTIIGELLNGISNEGAIEESFQKKLAELRSQAGNIAGSDDVDLMEEYSSNKLKYVLYTLSDRMRKNIADLFYYCGYKRGFQGVPNKTSRYWFNYVKADIVFDSTENMSDEVLNDIIARYKEGLTVMHHHNISSVDYWDWNQEYENWEMIFYNN